MKKKAVSKAILFHIGDFVFSKVRGYAPWPSIISEVNGTRAKVTFFCPEKSWYIIYDYEVNFSLFEILFVTKLFFFSYRAWVQMAHIFPYSESAAFSLVQKHEKNRLLKRSIAEMEFVINEMRQKLEKIQSTVATHRKQITAASQTKENQPAANAMKSKRNGTNRFETFEPSARVLRSNSQRAKLRSAKKR